MQEIIEILNKKLPMCPNVQGREKYINTSVLVPLLNLKKEIHFLFQIRSSTINQGGEICFLGGKFDIKKDKTLKDTAIRECEEEIGLKKETLNILGQIDTIVAPMGVTVDSFIAIANIKNLNKLNINKNEVEKVFTLPLNFFKKNRPEKYYVKLEIQPFELDKNGEKRILFPAEKLGLPKKYTKPWGGRKYRVLVYKTPKGIIWGITAEIIYELIKILDNK